MNEKEIKMVNILLGQFLIDFNSEDEEMEGFLKEAFNKTPSEFFDFMKDQFINDEDIPEEIKKMKVIDLIAIAYEEIHERLNEN